MSFCLRFRYRLVAAAVFLLLPLALLAVPVSFNIPAQPTADALMLFARQSDSRVLFSYKALKNERSPEVVGELEPMNALAKLLVGTGYVAVEQGPKKYLVKPMDQKVGAIRGTLLGDNGEPLLLAQVILHDTNQTVATDKDGAFVFPAVDAGTYMLVVTYGDYPPLHIADVAVNAGKTTALESVTLHHPVTSDESAKLEPFVLKDAPVERLPAFQVYGAKSKPYTDTNIDLPRGVDDVQPYYIIDWQSIQQSGASNVSELLKQRLTMDTTALLNSQSVGASAQHQNTLGNTSSVNLRGLGSDKTLVLVNGRRLAGLITGNSSDEQTDLNGIPMSAIERIEILPSSASGIYGGSAIGGVINVILKKNYSGGDITTTYDNTFNSDAPVRSLALSYGLSLEKGKTQVMFSAQWSNAKALQLRDRVDVLQRAYDKIRVNYPEYFNSSTTPFLGTLPNISATSTAVPSLTFDDGTSLGAISTHISPGTSSATSTADLKSMLLANAGTWNTDLPATAQRNTGLFQQLGVDPSVRTFRGSINRQMTENLELLVDYTHAENNATTLGAPFKATYTLSGFAPTNPFKQTVNISVPIANSYPNTTQSNEQSLTVDLIAKLPLGWTGMLDFAHSQSAFKNAYYYYDNSGLLADLRSGLVNPFVDTTLYPLALSSYLVPTTYGSSSSRDEYAIRGTGPLFSLPWGQPTLAVGLEHVIRKVPDNTQTIVYPVSTSQSMTNTYFAQRELTDSVYSETTIPLVAKDRFPLLRSLDLQLSGRAERHSVDGGTQGMTTYLDYPDSPEYIGSTKDGLPFKKRVTYNNTNGTVGLAYRPVEDVILRASFATAYLPPAPSDLVPSPTVAVQADTVYNAKTGNYDTVDLITGGNANLVPQHSRSWNVGLVWEPQQASLKGLRFDVEYYRIMQYDAISSLGAQQIVDLESTYRGRVTRDSSGTITRVDITSLNLFKRETQGWDMSLDYRLKTDVGYFNFHAAESTILHINTQYALASPDYDAAGIPSEGGAAKIKANTSFSWDWHSWNVGWTTRYYGSYKQYGIAGGPQSLQYMDGAAYPYYIDGQGADSIPSQMYHDFVFGYEFGRGLSEEGSKLARTGRKILEGMSVQAGVKNVFNKMPPYDFYYIQNYFTSPYGDLRGRSFWVSLKKEF